PARCARPISRSRRPPRSMPLMGSCASSSPGACAWAVRTSSATPAPDAASSHSTRTVSRSATTARVAAPISPRWGRAPVCADCRRERSPSAPRCARRRPRTDSASSSAVTGHRQPHRRRGPAIITLLIADDQRMVRVALAALLGMETDPEVIAQCADGTEVLPAVDDKRPDVALLDVDMPGPDGLSVAEMLAEKHPQVRVIIVTTYGRPGWVKRAMDSGVDGFMVKDAPVDHLAEGIRRVMAGLRVIDPELVVESTMHGETPLTERETEVLRAAADGASVGEVASALFLSAGTVRNRLSAAIGK